MNNSSMPIMSRKEIETILIDINQCQYNDQLLRNKIIAAFFFEPSTRTSKSFEIAANSLGANFISWSAQGSSKEKGESDLDTINAIVAMGAELLIVRHDTVGFADKVRDLFSIPVINAGDGSGSHPTQAIVDGYSLMNYHQSLDGLKVAFVGNVSHSRVANSCNDLFKKLGAETIFVAPKEWMPLQNKNCNSLRFNNIDSVIEDVDVIYALRTQTERMSAEISTEDFIRDFGLHKDRVDRMKPDAKIMHAGPVNRGMELDDYAVDNVRSIITDQLRNLVPARRSILVKCFE